MMGSSTAGVTSDFRLVHRKTLADLPVTKTLREAPQKGRGEDRCGDYWRLNIWTENMSYSSSTCIHVVDVAVATEKYVRTKCYTY